MPFGDKELRALGTVTVAFSGFDLFAQLLLWVLLDIDVRAGLLMTERQSLRDVLEWSKSLAEMEFGADSEVARQVSAAVELAGPSSASPQRR